jgi:hypothetical protein
VPSIIDSLQWKNDVPMRPTIKWANFGRSNSSIIYYPAQGNYTIAHPLLGYGGPYDVLEAECILRELIKKEGGDPGKTLQEEEPPEPPPDLTPEVAQGGPRGI